MLLLAVTKLMLQKNYYQSCEEHDFSGFDRENWIMQDEEKHRRDVHKLLQEVTKGV